MEQEVVNSLQNLRLTKEEESEISITAHNRADLLEECSLSLFGKLLTDRQQNHRALKSTLKVAWKMGSELRIIEVGNNIFQFKFGSRFQMEWVENCGPWNFENNLLLLCRWKKGLTSENINFTHSPFWVQLWGLPFELMSEMVGRDIGNSMGRFIEIDKRAFQSEQAKYLRIKVDLPIDKPLCRGGNVVGIEGDKYWVQYKYERLPIFCFICGMMGHDDKHCHAFPDGQQATPQYGEWLRAFSSSKSGSNRQKNLFNDRINAEDNTQNGDKNQATAQGHQSSSASQGEGVSSNGSVQNSKSSKDESKFDQIWRNDLAGSSACQIAKRGMGCDNLIDDAQVLKHFEVPLDRETIPLPMDVSGTKERLGDVVTKVGQNIKEAQDPPEATNPNKSSKPA